MQNTVDQLCHNIQEELEVVLSRISSYYTRYTMETKDMKN